MFAGWLIHEEIRQIQNESFIVKMKIYQTTNIKTLIVKDKLLQVANGSWPQRFV